jgi:uncharacterized protein YndB with AHSA1/START domain
MAVNISIITIHASKQKVWDALTIPEFVKQWQYGSDLQTSWQEGTEIRFKTAWEDKIFEQWGQVLEIKPTDFIKYNLFAPRPGLEDKPENYFVMKYILTELNGNTKLEIIQEDNRPNADQQPLQGDENPILQALKTVAETI